MDKLIARQVNKNVDNQQQQYTYPPPHAHSLISKRETTKSSLSTSSTSSSQSPMVINTEIKQNTDSSCSSPINRSPNQRQPIHSTFLHNNQQQQQQLNQANLQIPQSSSSTTTNTTTTQQLISSSHHNNHHHVHNNQFNQHNNTNNNIEGGSPISTHSADDVHNHNHHQPLVVNGGNGNNNSDHNKIISSPETGNNIMVYSSSVGEHEIKFTKTEGCTPSTCICVFIAILLISIGASSGIFYGLRSYEDALLKDLVFKGQFTVTRGDSYSPEFEKRSSDEFKETSRKYKTRLDILFKESGLTKAFRRSEILALERTPKPRSDDLIVHFNLVFSPLLRPRLSPADVYSILIEEIRADRKKSFKNTTIDPNSIDITERKSDGGRKGLFYTSSPSFPAAAQFLENPSPWEARIGFPGLLEGLTTEPTPPPRRCVPIELPFCYNLLQYNYTSYPNIGGHWNLTSLESELISYRQIVDAECYPLARDFICQVIQPQCWEDEIIPPCREYCEDFMISCKDWLVKSITDKLKCKQFPSSSEETSSSTTSPTTSSSLTTSPTNPSHMLYTTSSHEKLSSRLVGKTENENRVQLKCRVKPTVSVQRSAEPIRSIQITKNDFD
ncbi:uncharacterized protein LOC128385427 [Panonychus citri]|uniref:uncharacterized protein LOC128385427 n=1 Tax=Panonychus citri TaxID=50023 RepID=UPI002307D24B|nr:uncharacterized protein LOC128385427 [Panonychus citri]